MLLKKRIVYTKLNLYIEISITRSIPLPSDYLSPRVPDIIRQVVSVSTITWLIRYIYY